MWEPLQFFLGEWRGSGSGEPGDGQYERTYELILEGKFILVRNRSVYPPQEKNPSGEIHEDMGIISYDKGRKTYIYRQFHGEGFINQYVLETHSEDYRAFSFISEAIENIAAGWRARETYQVISPEEFVETFELAPPGQDFGVYTQCHLSKVPASSA